MNRRVVVITGASGGIGAALAELCGKRGARVVLVARREKELREVAGRSGLEALPIVADVTEREDVERVVRSAIAEFGGIEAWVSNAGRAITRNVSELTDDDVDEMMRANVKSVLYGVQAVLPHFRERGRGHFLTVSSALARLPFAPFRSAYSASKAAVNSLMMNLRMELRPAFPEIFVSVVHPGVVATDFGLNALHGGADSRSLPHAQTAEEVAAVLWSVIETPRADVYTRPESRALVGRYYSAEDVDELERQPPFSG